MSIDHHPHEDALAELAAGALPVGLAIVVRAHLESCPTCTTLAASFVTIGGALLDALPPAEMSEDALERTMAMIDDEARPAPQASTIGRHAAAMPDGQPLPEALRDCDVGPWRWVGPGIRISRIRAPSDPKANLLMLRVSAGRKLPLHSHTGAEYTQVLYGSFSDGRGRYAPGDLDEAGPDVRHQPVVDPDGECICLAAIDGRMRPDGMIARFMQPFVGL